MGKWQGLLTTKQNQSRISGMCTGEQDHGKGVSL